MSRLFLSHSSTNNAEALALAKWLETNGWDDYFLDISATEGIDPGEKWREKLRDANKRCVAVVLLISRAWLDSDWCRTEFQLAQQLDKKIIGILIENLPLKDLPQGLTSDWQISNLALGEQRESFVVSRDPIVPQTTVDFATSGLDALKRGLMKAGFDPESFPWPPPQEPERAPYRGLKPYEAQDAAVFFGRDSAIIRGLDRIRRMRKQRVDQLLVIQGASGAGKSSFMRAGLWPRLWRDDDNFYPLPIIRPSYAALNGDRGLVSCLASAFAESGNSDIQRGAIRQGFQETKTEKVLADYLHQLRDAVMKSGASARPEPTIILPIDQGEELYTGEGSEEAASLRAQLAGLANQDQGLQVLIIVTIRTDHFEYLQTDNVISSLGRQIIDLTPMDRTEYKSVIEGPAQRATEGGKRLEIEAGLSTQLLNDTHGADALPLLAFTLEQLFEDYGANCNLTLAEYRDGLGGVVGSIEQAIQGALEDPTGPAISPDKAIQQSLLKQTFIPALAEIDEFSGERRRRVARISDLPKETLPIIERLGSKRLLVRDKRRLGESDKKEDVVEVAHEALLRRWPDLVGWLDEDEKLLKALSSVMRDAETWHAKQQDDELLLHSGERLRVAEGLLLREDFKERIAGTGEHYLKRCRENEDAKAKREQKQRRRLSQLTVVAVVAALLAIGFAISSKEESSRAQDESNRAEQERDNAVKASARADRERDNALTTLSQFQANLSLRETKNGRPYLGALLAIEALPSIEEKANKPYVAAAEDSLNAAVKRLQKRWLLKGHTGRVVSASFNATGTQVVTASYDKTARLWHTDTGELVAELTGHTGAVRSASFNAAGIRVVTTSEDTVRLWDTEGELVAELTGHTSAILSASFNAAGTRVVTTSEDKTARLWNTDTGEQVAELAGHTGAVRSASFNAAGTRVVTTSEDTARLWDTEGELVAELTGHTSAVLSASFNAAGTRVVTTSEDKTARLWRTDTGELGAELTGHTGAVLSASFDAAGTRVVTTSADKTARMWDIEGELVAELTGHTGAVLSASFNAAGTQMVTASEDKTARLWRTDTGKLVAELTGRTSGVWSSDEIDVYIALPYKNEAYNAS